MVEGDGGGGDRREIGDGGDRRDVGDGGRNVVALDHGSNRGFSSSAGDGLKQGYHCDRCNGCCCNTGSSDSCGTSGSHKEISGGSMMHKTKSNKIMAALRDRESGFSPSGLHWPMSETLALSTFKMRQEIDLYFGEEELRGFNRFLRRRKPIADIIAIKDIIVVRAFGGLTASFSRVSHKQICYLNEGSSENIETIFLNKYRDSLVMVSSHEEDDFIARCCRENHVGCLRKKVITTEYVFEGEEYVWPGFITFDDINAIALIKNKIACRTFDLNTYSLKHEFTAENVDSVSFSPQILLVRYNAAVGQLHLQLKSVENGETLKTLKWQIEENLQCIGIINEKLLVKQRLKALQVIDLRSLEQLDVAIGKFMLQPLYGRNTFLCFQQKSSEVRDSDGQFVRRLENHVISHIGSLESKVCIIQEEDIVISACTAEGVSDETVNVSCIESGKLLFSIQPNVRVTALCFNEDLKEIYVGTACGTVQIWSV